MDIGKKIVQLEQQITALQRSSRLSHASIENAAVQVYDGSGSLRSIVGMQADGTTAVNVVNGPPPPQPSAPIVASVLGGVTVSWDGLFAGGAVLPLDWARVEVHASLVNGFTPIPATLQGTIETAQGATVVVPCDTPVYVRLMARNTSGTASIPSDQAGPFGPTPVVADDILDGIVTTVKLADDAVTQAKVAVGAIGSTELALGIGNLVPDPSFEGAYTASLIAAHTDWTQVTPGNNSAKALHVDCTAGATTWKNIELARYPVLPGERHFLGIDFKTSATFNGSGVKLMFRYEDATATVLGYGVADKAFTPGAGWDRATAQVQAPAGTVTAILLVEASACSAGEAWFDNAEVSTLVVGGKVAAGSITATEIAALTILAGNLAADSVAAGKIAADAVTAREIAASTVTASEIAANTIVAGNLAAGSVDATALSATAITGKTITGGTITGTTITGGTMQTATSGERITLNESAQNKVIVYNSSGTAINELSSRGLLVKGTTGAVLWLNPNATYPQLQLYNAAATNKATVQVVETVTGDANLENLSGPFTGSGYTDMVWRSYLARDFAVIERRRASTATIVGARLYMEPGFTSLGIRNDDDTTQNCSVYIEPNYIHTDAARFQVNPPASSSSGLYVNGATGHTGNLFRAAVNGTDKFTVDKDGNATAAGNITSTPVTTTSGLTAASGFATTNFYGYKVGKLVVLDLYMNRSGTTITATSGNITPDVQIATTPSGWRPTHSTINGTWDDGTSYGGFVIGTDGVVTLRTASSDITNGRNLRLHITFIQD